MFMWMMRECQSPELTAYHHSTLNASLHFIVETFPSHQLDEVRVCCCGLMSRYELEVALSSFLSSVAQVFDILHYVGGKPPSVT